MSWDDVEYPPNNFDHRVILEKGKVRPASIEDATDLAQRWQPQNGVLIAEPGAYTFLPPISITPFQEAAHQAVRRMSITLSISSFLPALIFLVVTLFVSTKAFTYFGIFMLMTLVFALDYIWFLRKTEHIEKRARFFYWFSTSSTRVSGFVFSVSVMIIAGVIQYTVQTITADASGPFFIYGTMYDEVSAGQYWRLLTGVFLHYSIAHFGVNLLFLIFTCSLCWPVCGARLTLVGFTIGSIAGSSSQHLLGGSVFDNCGGVSFAIYGMLGMLAVHGWLKQTMPPGLPLYITGIAITSILAAETFSETAATAGHTGALLIGLLIASINFQFGGD